MDNDATAEEPIETRWTGLWAVRLVLRILGTRPPRMLRLFVFVANGLLRCSRFQTRRIGGVWATAFTRTCYVWDGQGGQGYQFITFFAEEAYHEALGETST